MKKVLVTVFVLAVLGGGGYAYYRYRSIKPAPTVSTAAVSRGDIADQVGATGTLQAVTTVQVGTQVSGTIQQLNADFNSLVRKGQVLARLDPSLFQTQIEQAQANLLRSQADVERLRVALDDASTKVTRARELSGRQLLPKSELDAAEVAVRSAQAQVRSAEAQVTQARASLNQNQVNLQHTVIEAPIDGLVISRNVDVGQTVAASMQAPTLFVLAADLTKMQVIANLDESDVGRIRPGQHVTFRVDAYPTDTFTGSVAQVRLQPIVQQNVVTYATVIDVPNPDLKLKPGMTANVNVEIARRTNVLRVPNTALRFRPSNDIFAALGQTPPPGGAGGGRGEFPGGGRGRGSAPVETATAGPAAGVSSGGAAPTAAAGAAAAAARATRDPRAGAAAGTAPSRAERLPADQTAGTQAEGGTSPSADAEGSRRGGGRGGGFGTPEGRARMLERLQSLAPDERERMIERMRARGFDPTAAGEAPGAARGSRGAPARGGSGGGSARPAAPAKVAAAPQATNIDALFGPLPTVDTTGRVWLYVDKQLRPVRVRLGITDGQVTELLRADGVPGSGEPAPPSGGVDPASGADRAAKPTGAQGMIAEGTELVTNVTTGTEAARPAPAAGAFPGFGQQPGRFGGPGGGFGGGGGGNRGGGR